MYQERISDHPQALNDTTFEKKPDIKRKGAYSASWLCGG